MRLRTQLATLVQNKKILNFKFPSVLKCRDSVDSKANLAQTSAKKPLGHFGPLILTSLNVKVILFTTVFINVALSITQSRRHIEKQEMETENGN